MEKGNICRKCGFSQPIQGEQGLVVGGHVTQAARVTEGEDGRTGERHDQVKLATPRDWRLGGHQPHT